MDYKFIDTKAVLVINGRQFSLDIGEIEVGENAEALIAACFDSKVGSTELISNVRAALDKLLGAGAADTLLKDISATNEIQVRRLGLAVGSGVNKKRAEMILSAFTSMAQDAPEEQRAD